MQNTDLTIRELIGVQAQQRPRAAAILAPGREPLTYDALREQITESADSLAAMGFRRDDRVALVMPNGPEMGVAFLSVACVAACAPLNPDYRSEDFDFYLRDVGAKALVLPAGAPSASREVAAALAIPIVELHTIGGGKAGEIRLAGPQALATEHASPPGPDDIALILHTSGTTSRPKMVPLTHANLGVSAGNVCAAIGLRQDDRCLNVMPLFHIHGLVAVLLASLVSGGSVICTPGFYATEFFGWMDSLRPTWYSAVPTMHQAILARAGQNLPVIRRTRLRLIRSSSSPLPPQVMAETERVFNVPVIEAYGMTEASHQMASNPLPPDKRKPGSVGRAAGPEVAIMDGAGRVLPTGEAGEIVIRGSNVTHGYLNNPEANGLSFVKGWFRTGDLGFLDAEGYLFITGRIKEIINRGGEKIAPREIDEVLLDHPAVARAIAFAVPDPRLGEEVAAAVVLRPGAEVTPAELRKYVEQRLAPFKVPRQVLVLESIPTGPTGKMQRIGLAEKLGLTGQKPAPHGKSEYVPPRTDVEAALVEIWCEVLRVERVGVDDPFLDLGGDSMLAMLLLTRVRARFGVDLSIADFFDAPTVAEQGGLVEASRLTSQGGTMPSRPTS